MTPVITALSMFFIQEAALPPEPTARNDDAKLSLWVHGDRAGVDHDVTGTVLMFQDTPRTGDERWRAGYIHPLHAPSGAILTENAPEDHIHHRGIFTAWRRILVDGESIGDFWDGTHVFLGEPEQVGWATDGKSPFYYAVARNWMTDISGEAVPFMKDETTVSTEVSADAMTTTVTLTTTLTALVPGLQLGGTDDEKGYGGMSFRFAHPDKMLIESDGEMLEAINAAMTTGETVTFTYEDVPENWPAAISVSCTVNGEPWTSWVLRQSLSMQNCAWPGNTLAGIPMDGEVVLEATIVIEQ